MPASHAAVAPPATVCTDVATLQLVALYIAVHDDPTPEAFSRLFTPDLAVFGAGAPPEGRGAADYLVFLQSIQGMRFRQRAGSALGLDDGGRIVLEWTVSDSAGQQLAAGIDRLQVEEGRIRRIVAVY